MRTRQARDPRLEALFGSGEARDFDVRPVVRLPNSGLPPWSIALTALLAAALLFWVLEPHREQAQPSVRSPAAGTNGQTTEPPPLYIPLAPAPAPQVTGQQRILPVPVQPSATAPRPIPVAREFPPAYYPPQMPRIPVMEQPHIERQTSGGPALVIDRSGAASQPGNSEAGAAQPGKNVGAAAPIGRVRASGLANRTTTVPQGALIPAVLETALDSNHPGFARAIVSRDVRGFDGTSILIPRGSRVIGEYASDIHAGQNRALITWTRLIRPDGITIAIDSPSVDTLGRAGVRASVNTHFWQQFGSALLRSTINIGTGLAARVASGPTIFAVPGNIPGAGPTPGYTPTLKVREGTSINIFVSRDLEFPGESQS